MRASESLFRQEETSIVLHKYLHAKTDRIPVEGFVSGIGMFWGLRALISVRVYGVGLGIAVFEVLAMHGVGVRRTAGGLISICSRI